LRARAGGCHPGRLRGAGRPRPVFALAWRDFGRRAGRGLGCAWRLPQMLGQAADRRVVEQVDDGHLPAQQLLEPAVCLGHQERVPAQVEEVVMDADLVDAEKLLPDARQVAFQLALREDDIRR